MQYRGIRFAGSVTNITFGLLCDSAGAPTVCVPSRSLTVTGDSHCVDNRATKPCTRYGFAFDYDLPTDTVTLACRFVSSIPQRHVSPDSVLIHLQCLGLA